MFRLCAALRLTFASEATPTGSLGSAAASRARTKKRSFLVRPANRRDPYTTATHTRRRDHHIDDGAPSSTTGGAGEADPFAAGHRRQASGVAGRASSLAAHRSTSTPTATTSAARSFLSQREAFRRSQQQGGEPFSTTTVDIRTADGGNVSDPFASPSMRAAAARRSSAAASPALPADFYEPPRSSAKHDRAARMRELLQQNAVSTVDVTSGGEADIDYGNLPPSEFLGRDGWMTVPEASSMYQDILNKDALPSRSSMNTWSVLRHTALPPNINRHSGTGATAPVQPSSSATTDDVPEEEALLQTHADSQRTLDLHNGGYRSTFDSNANLAPIPDAVANPRSTYALRKLFLSGLSGYLNMITPQEELLIAEEVLQLTQSDTACYVAEEARYCVNLFEHTLGVPSRDPLALPLARCPTLQTVFQRLLDLRLIPSPPNVVQISEFVGTFSGYPPHRMPRGTGPFLGLLNLVSPTVLHMRHCEHPWAPRLMMLPRSLFVVEPPCLQEYALGYADTHQPFHNFDYATRTAKDYRIEILFATMDVENSKLLREAVAMTEYADRRRLTAGEGVGTDNGGNPGDGGRNSSSERVVSGTQVDEAIQRLKHSSGAAAQEALAASVGRKPRALTSSGSSHRATSRIAELKARHALLKAHTNTQGSSHIMGGGGQLSRSGNVQAGHRPGPRRHP